MNLKKQTGSETGWKGDKQWIGDIGLNNTCDWEEMHQKTK